MSRNADGTATIAIPPGGVAGGGLPPERLIVNVSQVEVPAIAEVAGQAAGGELRLEGELREQASPLPDGSLSVSVENEADNPYVLTVVGDAAQVAIVIDISRSDRLTGAIIDFAGRYAATYGKAPDLVGFYAESGTRPTPVTIHQSTDIRGPITMSGDRFFWLGFDGGNAIHSVTKAGGDPQRTALPNTSFMQDTGGVTGITTIGVDDRFYYWGAIYPQTNEINSVYAMDRGTGTVVSVSGGTHRLDTERNFYVQNIVPTGDGMVMGNTTYWETSTGVALGRLSYWNGATLATVATDTHHPTTVYAADAEFLYYSGKDGVTRIARDGSGRLVIAPGIHPSRVATGGGRVVMVGDACFWPVQNDPDCINGFMGSGPVTVMDADGGNARLLVDFINDQEFTADPAQRPAVVSLELAADHAFVVTQEWVTADAANLSTIYRIRLADSTREVLYRPEVKGAAISALMLDGPRIYWQESTYAADTGVTTTVVKKLDL